MAVRVGSLFGSPASRARPWCGRNRGPSCAFVRRYVPTPVVRPYTSKKPASLRSVLAVPGFWPFKHARNSRARGVPKSRGRRVAAGAAVIEMRRIKRYFRFSSESLTPSSGTRARCERPWAASSGAGSSSKPSAHRSQLFRPSRASRPAFGRLGGLLASSSQGAPRGTPLGGKPRRRHPNPLLRVTSLHVHTGT